MQRLIEVDFFLRILSLSMNSLNSFPPGQLFMLLKDVLDRSLSIFQIIGSQYTFYFANSGRSIALLLPFSPGIDISEFVENIRTSLLRPELMGLVLHPFFAFACTGDFFIMDFDRVLICTLRYFLSIHTSNDFMFRILIEAIFALPHRIHEIVFVLSRIIFADTLGHFLNEAFKFSPALEIMGLSQCLTILFQYRFEYIFLRIGIVSKSR